MNKTIAARLALSLGFLVLGACGVLAGTIVHPEIAVYRSTSGHSGQNPVDEQGYTQGSAGAVQIPGVLGIAPGGPDWPNFVSASRLSRPYTIQEVKFVKQTPAQTVCPGGFPQYTVVQTGNGIRLHWPLMYESPGATFTLTINYRTLISLRMPGETSSSELHQEVWKWRVAAGVQDIDRAQELFHSLPFGLSEAPIISDEVLYSALKGRLADASVAYLAGDFSGLGDTLAAYRSAVSGARIMMAPMYPSPTGPGTGIASTMENPAGCILMLDASFMEPWSGGPAESSPINTPDSAAVIITDLRVVTLVGDGWFCTQSMDRTSGLKVIGTKQGLSAGMQVLLQGTMSTQGPERVLLMTACEILAPLPTETSPTTAISPLGMPNRAVGGAGAGYVPGFAGMTGLWNGALLVRTAGKVTASGGEFFYIDDGSGSRDGTDNTGLRVLLPGGVDPPAPDAYVAVTGISSWFESEGYGFPAVLLGSYDDVTIVRPAP